MSIRKKLMVAAVAPAVGLGLLWGGTSVFAAGFGFGGNATPDQVATRFQGMLQNEATLLGISVDEVKAGWAQGKTIVEIAKDHGITKEQLQQKRKDARAQQQKARLQALVDKGIITQAQADQRTQALQAKAQANAGKSGGYRGFRF